MLYQLLHAARGQTKKVKMVGAVLLFFALLGVAVSYRATADPGAKIPAYAGAEIAAGKSTNDPHNKKATNSLNSKKSFKQPNVMTQNNSTNQTGQTDCGALPAAHANLKTAHSPELRKLAEHEQVCGGAAVERGSFFVETPISVDRAIAEANEVTSKLREYDQFDIKPLVFMEPTNDGATINLDDFQNGAYDSALDTYFKQMKSNGLTDEQMGMWVFFPEGNTPAWGNTDPALFGTNVTKSAQAIKRYFSQAQVTVLLNSATFPDGNSWSNSSYKSLAPYLNSIPHGLVSSFGIQGFPWAAPADTDWASLYEPSIYLPNQLAAEAAHVLGINSIWLNTGTFSTSYAGQQGKQVNFPAERRSAQLVGVLGQANTLQSQGFQVAIHLFSENKAATAEGINWSYWDNPNVSTAHTNAYKTFIEKARAQHTTLWLFDSAE